MLYAQKLTKTEKQILKRHYKKSQCALVKERAHAIILSGQKRNASDIALILMRNKITIRQWINDFNERRISSIFHNYEGNINASKLTGEQREEVRKTLREPPRKDGLPEEFWTVPKLKNYLKTKFSIVYESDRSYHYLLRFYGFSFKLPSAFDIRRDKEQINKRLKEIHKEIKPFLESNDWEVFAADESRITWEAEIRRAWLKRNEKTVVKVHRSNEYQNFFGALNIKNHAAYAFRLDWQNQDEIIKSLRKLLAHCADKKICIIWDNAKWHKSKKLREELRKNKSLEHVHLINFPPYAPDVNPEEKVWNFGKKRISNNNVPDSFEKMISLFENSIRSKFFDYKIPEFVLR